jgi:signal transduction histidine kinase
VWHPHHTQLRHLHLHNHGYPPRRRRLQHLFFIWLALSIVATAATVWMLFWLTFPGELPSVKRMRQIESFMEQQFADRWTDEAARHKFAEDVIEAVGATLWIESASGQPLDRVGPDCEPIVHTLDVHKDGVLLGRVSACIGHEDHPGPLTPIVMLLGACTVLWGAAALVAHKIGRPLSLLIAVTREIGAGNLSARVRLGRYQKGELGLLAESVNDMASRIERQISDQRELLAAVSHEVRSPLARLRVSAELLRSDPQNVPALDALEREVIELDTLVGKLLVNSRLDFEALTKREVIGAELFAEVLARRKLPASLLQDGSASCQVSLDPTLVARALENLLDNAARYGNGPTRCTVRRAEPRENTRTDALVFEVCDSGPGFDVKSLPRVFDAFYRANNGTSATASNSADHSSLGLGLALVRRIAQAHGGRAWAENLSTGGAKVAFSVSLAEVRPAE